MSAPLLNGRAEVGKFYLVPCIKVDVNARSIWMDVNGYVPVLGPKHRDAEHLEFAHEHWHIDWRFVGEKQYRWATQKPSGAPHSSVLTNDSGTSFEPKLARAPELRRIKCKREMPDFPVVEKVIAKYEFGTQSATRWARLERAQAITCNKLKPGNICPHRGIDLTPFVKEDGTVICPGHGLRWDTKTGGQLPYQTRPA